MKIKGKGWNQSINLKEKSLLRPVSWTTTTAINGFIYRGMGKKRWVEMRWVEMMGEMM
jgi:hypothetical protein